MVRKTHVQFTQDSKLTQVEVIIDSVTDGKDTENEVKQRSNRSVITVNVTSLVLTPRTGRLGSFNGTLRQFLMMLMFLVSLHLDVCIQLYFTL